MIRIGIYRSTVRAVSIFLIYAVSFLLFTGCEKDNFNDIIDNESVLNNLPIPGNNGSILVSGILSDRVTLSWASAGDDSTPSAELQYMVVSSSSGNLNDTDSAVVNGTIAMSWTAGSSTHTVTGLTSGEIIYLNVLVKDGDGYISAYREVSVITAGSGASGSGTIYMVSAGQNKGDLGGRFGADLICRSYITVNYPSLPVSHMRAFISINAVDQIANFPVNFGVPAGVAIKGPTDTVIADNWADLMDYSIQNNLNDAVPDMTHWWSGSDVDGNWMSNATSCNGFTDDGNTNNGEVGDHTATDSAWIDYGTGGCNSNQTLLCIGW